MLEQLKQFMQKIREYFTNNLIIYKYRNVDQLDWSCG